MLPDFHGEIEVFNTNHSARIDKNAYTKETYFCLVRVAIIQVVKSLLILRCT